MLYMSTICSFTNEKSICSAILRSICSFGTRFSRTADRNTVEILGIWESLNNPNSKRIEFDTFRMEAGINSFVLTPQKWIDASRV
ncbi:MAG: hypothetical protein FWF81_14245 [Defluviitaleaceae bacterium]|nr:hypothetical protein [Defluviitaleaceae bacterium]